MLSWLMRRIHRQSYLGPNRQNRRQMAAVSRRSVRGTVKLPESKQKEVWKDD